MQENSNGKPFTLRTDRLGPLPVVNHFIRLMGINPLLEKHVPTDDHRCGLTYAKALGVLLRSIIIEREPIYRQQETVQSFATSMYDLNSAEATMIGDDRIGRALDRLYDADRAAMLTEAIVAIGKKFDVRFDRLHNDSTSVKFCGQYRIATGRRIRGKRAPWITYGYSKDHRPDLKQILFCLTTSDDGGIPVHFRCYDGNTNDTQTHIETWETLCAVTGKTDFLYVADSKLCVREDMNHIDFKHGRFVTVLPRSRSEDAEFREWIQTNQPQWEKVWDRPNPRRKRGPRDRWYVFKAPLPSREAWPIIWIYSELLALRHEQSRRERLASAIQQLEDLKLRLQSKRNRIRKPAEIDDRIETIVKKFLVERYIDVRRTCYENNVFRQTRRGRPGADTSYRKITRKRWNIEWAIRNDHIEYDRKSDGMYPLLTNDKSLLPAKVLEAHKGQPTIEKRFEQIKTVHELAPVFLKNEGRIEALFTLYFLGMLIQAIIERQVRSAMRREKIEELPLYPEERQCKQPTTEQILRIFSHAQRQILLKNGRVIQIFPMKLTPLQKQILELLGVPLDSFNPACKI
jgi:transposase